MDLSIDGVVVAIPGLEPDHLTAIHVRLQELLQEPPGRVKNRDAIEGAFSYAVEMCPNANPSDLWHHIIYREFTRTIGQARQVNDPKQSWVRSSGDAFELFIQNYYNRRLAKDGVWLTALFTNAESKAALQEMGIHEEVGGSKLDLSIRTAATLIGGIHAKASLAERVSDDVPASTAMMRRGYLSALVTLDVKSFPPSWNVSDARAYQNRGELGTPQQPSDKRMYIESHGSFDLCVSYNTRTVSSPGPTKSGKQIYTVTLGGQPDALEEAIRARL